jgi:hypothetical protein
LSTTQLKPHTSAMTPNTSADRRRVRASVT